MERKRKILGREKKKGMKEEREGKKTGEWRAGRKKKKKGREEKEEIMRGREEK